MATKQTADILKWARLGAASRLRELDEERAASVKALPGLTSGSAPASGARTTGAAGAGSGSVPVGRKRRKMSAAARKRIGDAQKTALGGSESRQGLAFTARHFGTSQLSVSNTHTLGLRRRSGRDGRLVCLYYDVPSREGATHLDEIAGFTEATAPDGVRFSSVSYQAVLLRLAEQRSAHAAWVDYIVERYL